jgi:WD40 repeat protein
LPQANPTLVHTPQITKRLNAVEPKKAELPKKPREDQLLKLIKKRKQDRQRNPMGIDDTLLSFTQNNDFEVSFNKFQQVFGKLKINKTQNL